jgi:uncharacterized protein (TIGR02646 family)
MIKINRTLPAPRKLQLDGFKARKKLIRDYKKDPSSYTKANPGFTINESIYRHPTVKTALIDMQSEKCCFCEANVKATSDGDVEHFRPKKAIFDQKQNGLKWPGYFWLSYEWSNLMFSCQNCNQREKKNHFPLRSEKTRANPRKMNCSKERPLFIDPSDPKDNPAKYIGFKGGIPVAINGNLRGYTTIKRLGLGRSSLNNLRKDKLTALHALEKLLVIAENGNDEEVTKECKKEFVKLIRVYADSSSPFAGMTRSNYGQYL